MQSDFPTNTRGLGRRIGQSQAFGLLAARCSSTPAHCLQSIREKRLDEPAGVSFEEFRAIRATPAPPALLPRRLPELASFRKNPRPIRVVDTSGILLELASFGQQPKPLRLQHLPPQIRNCILHKPHVENKGTAESIPQFRDYGPTCCRTWLLYVRPVES